MKKLLSTKHRKPVSLETRKKLSDSHIGTNIDKNNKPVEQLFNGIVVGNYPSLQDASLTLRNGIKNIPNISACCCGKRQYCMGFQWRHVPKNLMEKYENI